MKRSWALILVMLLTLPAQAAVEIYYLHNDHLGTPRVVTDDQKNVVWKGHVKPFGEMEVAVEDITNHRRFPGQRFDIESRLHYNYFRDYDPGLGRYIQSDPRGILVEFSDPQRLVAWSMGLRIPEEGGGDYINHLYSYAQQNPLSYTDPTGELPLGLLIPPAIKLAEFGTCLALCNSSNEVGAACAVIGADAKDQFALCLAGCAALTTIPGGAAAKHGSNAVKSAINAAKKRRPKKPKKVGKTFGRNK